MPDKISRSSCGRKHMNDRNQCIFLTFHSWVFLSACTQKLMGVRSLHNSEFKNFSHWTYTRGFFRQVYSFKNGGKSSASGNGDWLDDKNETDSHIIIIQSEPTAAFRTFLCTARFPPSWKRNKVTFAHNQRWEALHMIISIVSSCKKASHFWLWLKRDFRKLHWHVDIR